MIHLTTHVYEKRGFVGTQLALRLRQRRGLKDDQNSQRTSFVSCSLWGLQASVACWASPCSPAALQLFQVRALQATCA